MSKITKSNKTDALIIGGIALALIVAIYFGMELTNEQKAQVRAIEDSYLELESCDEMYEFLDADNWEEYYEMKLYRDFFLRCYDPTNTIVGIYQGDEFFSLNMASGERIQTECKSDEVPFYQNRTHYHCSDGVWKKP